MKTIFDKVDPGYLDCAAGTCEHATHQPNLLLWTVVGVLMIVATKIILVKRQ